MADVQTLEQRFEGISVQDENQDNNAPAASLKPKVLRRTTTPSASIAC